MQTVSRTIDRQVDRLFMNLDTVISYSSSVDTQTDRLDNQDVYVESNMDDKLTYKRINRQANKWVHRQIGSQRQTRNQRDSESTVVEEKVILFVVDSLNEN